jgi:hypothetical protein
VKAKGQTHEHQSSNFCCNPDGEFFDAIRAHSQIAEAAVSCPSHDHLHRAMNGVKLQVQTKQMRCFLAFSTSIIYCTFTWFLSSQVTGRLK